jgi:hypothetical protein
MSSPGLLESMETMAKLWLADTASSPLLLLLLSFAFSLGSGNAEGSSNGLGDFPLLVFFFFLSVCLLGFPVQCVFPCSFSLFRYLPLSFCLRFLAPVPSGFGSCSAPCFFLVSVPCVIGLFVPCSVRKSPLFCLSVFPLFPLCFFPMIFGSIPPSPLRLRRWVSYPFYKARDLQQPSPPRPGSWQKTWSRFGSDAL